MSGLILIIENYPGRGDCIVRLLRQFCLPFEVLTSNGQPIKLASNVKGIILSGGPQSVIDIESDAGIRLRPVLDVIGQAARRRLPVLGICLGHQLVSTWGGGKVAKMAKKVVGFQEVTIFDDKDPVLGALPSLRPSVFQYHQDYVASLPEGWQILGKSETCMVEAVRAPDLPIWGVQFHPEIIVSDAEAIVKGQPLPLQSWDSVRDVDGPYLIRSFSEICGLTD
jgi:GMP synthase (glutamine-hydrolysing)